MKKIIVLSLVLLSVNLQAQKVAVQTAYNYLRYDELDKAKEAIDAAALHESTMGSAKTWYYRGNIYQAIYGTSKEKYLPLKPGSLDQARISFEKTMELDTKKEYSEEVTRNLYSIASQFLNDGVDAFKDSKYDEAVKNFEMAAEVNKKNFNKVDTLAIYNAALAADKMTDKTLAKKYLNQCAEMNYGGAKVYSILTNLYLNEKDTVTALSTIASGRKKFTDDNSLVIQELNIYLSSGKDKEAFQLIDAAIQKDSTNANLHFAKGSIADKLSSSSSTENKPSQKTTSDITNKKNYKSEAIDSYKKAISYNPNYFDAYYNLGAMYFNEGAEMTNKANEIPTNKMAEYDAAKKKYEAKFKEAQPYLEKAHEINPKDIPTMQSLRQLYARLGDLAKAEEMKKAIEAAK